MQANRYIALILLLMFGLTWYLMGKKPQVKEADRNENVLLIHGLDDNKESYKNITFQLHKAGFHVYQIQYNPFDTSWLSILDTVNKQIDARIDTALSMNVLTHSVGSIVFRKIYEANNNKNWGKTIFMSPVNVFSYAIDSVMSTTHFASGKESAIYKSLNNSSEIDTLPIPEMFGVIAGTRSAFGFADELTVGQNDGVVTVESTLLPGLTDYALYEDDHSFIRYNSKVAKDIVYFMDQGVFKNSQRNQFLFALE